MNHRKDRCRMDVQELTAAEVNAINSDMEREVSNRVNGCIRDIITFQKNIKDLEARLVTVRQKLADIKEPEVVTLEGLMGGDGDAR